MAGATHLFVQSRAARKDLFARVHLNRDRRRTRRLGRGFVRQFPCRRCLHQSEQENRGNDKRRRQISSHPDGIAQCVRMDLQMDSSWSQFRALDVWGDVLGSAVKKTNDTMNNISPSISPGRLWVISCTHPPDQLRADPPKRANPMSRLTIP